MQVNFNPALSSFKGKCTVGKDIYQKIFIADNILKCSNNQKDAIEKARILGEAAQIIARKTPEDADLYIDFPRYKKSRNPMEPLRYGFPIVLYSREEKYDKCVGYTQLDSMVTKHKPNYMQILTRQLINEYFDGSIEAGAGFRIPDRTPSEDTYKPIIDEFV